MRSIKRWWDRLVGQWPLGPKSNGMRVRRSTARHIRAGNAAREQQDWLGAAQAYCEALTIEPGLQHIWVQLGHMQKEAGAIEDAARAYEEAARLRPNDAEPLLLMGHMAKAWRQPADAAGYFITALQRDRTNLPAMSELARLMPDRDDVDAACLADALAVLRIDPADLPSDETARLPPGAKVLDVTDLIAFFGQRRLPTGIQRVQIEVSLACLETRLDPQPIFCVYASARRGWVALPHDRFAALCRLARQSDDSADPVWIRRLDQLYCEIAVARVICFGGDTVLVNLGTSWSDRNYLLDIRTARTRDGLTYVPLVFDLIPLIGPHWFMQSLVRDYRAWFGSLLHSADGYLAISQATRADLLRVSAERAAPVPPQAVPVVRLDGDFRQASADAGFLQSYGLEPQRYVLLVSTLEPRKNHRGAFEAWLSLIDSIGEAAVPRLVCVGARGWLNEHLHRMLHDRPALQRVVLILHGIPDAILAGLYEHCLFALYPSFYEGWGLPVSEALSYGKVPAISHASSLPEAGGAFARYFDPHDPSDIAATVRALLDPDVRQRAEAAIRKTYAPRPWHRIAHDVVANGRTVRPRGDATLPRVAGPGTWTLALSHRGGDIDRTPPEGGRADPATGQRVRQGEALRHGRAWLSPSMTGCRIAGDDAVLWFSWSGSPGRTLQLHFAVTAHKAVVRIGSGDVFQTHTAQSGSALTVSWALPDTATIVRIAIVPVAGDIVVEQIRVS